MRALELLKVLKTRQIDERLAVEALRHQSYIRILDAKGNLLRTEQEVRFATENQTVHVGYQITRRGRELLRLQSEGSKTPKCN